MIRKSLHGLSFGAALALSAANYRVSEDPSMCRVELHDEGALYVTIITDLKSRRIIASMSDAS